MWTRFRTMIDALIKRYIVPALSERGYRKKARTWSRRQGEIAQVINLQRSRFSESGPRFTLNIGVFSDQLWELFWGKAVPVSIREEHCFPRFRVGILLADFNRHSIDRWWTLESESDLSAVGEEVKGLLEEKCLPVLDSIVDLSSIMGLAQRVQSDLPLDRLYMAILRYLMGEVEPALREFSQLGSNPHWGERANQIEARLRCI